MQVFWPQALSTRLCSQQGSQRCMAGLPALGLCGKLPKG